MRIKQHLENYTDRYTDKNLWKMFETKHYIFYFFKNSVAEDEIKIISDRQEKAYNKIITTLDIKNKKKIKYYIYPTEDDKKRLMGSDGFAQAILHDYSVHIIYTNKIKPIGEHEDTHLLTSDWDQVIGFFQEGLAEYMSGCVWGKDKKPSELFVVKKIKKINLKKMFSHKDWMTNAEKDINYYYPLACSFTKFLIERYSLNEYIKLYKLLKRTNTQLENIKIFENIFGKLEENQEKYINKIHKKFK